MRPLLSIEELLATHLAAQGLDYRAEPIADQPSLELVGRAWDAFLEFAHADVPDVGDGVSVGEDMVVMEALPERPPKRNRVARGALFSIARQVSLVDRNLDYVGIQTACLTFWISQGRGQRVQAGPSIWALTRDAAGWADELKGTGFGACLAEPGFVTCITIE